MMPSVMSDRKSPAAMLAFTCSPSQPKPALIQSIGYVATLKMVMNNPARMPSRITQPQTGCTNTWSQRSVGVRRSASLRATVPSSNALIFS